MKILASNGSDLNLLRKLVGTDTWVKVRLASPYVDFGNDAYIQVLGINSDAVSFLQIPASDVEGNISYLDEPEGTWCIADLFESRWTFNIDSIRVIRPYEFLETWEIQSALEFAGFPKEFEGEE